MSATKRVSALLGLLGGMLLPSFASSQPVVGFLMIQTQEQGAPAIDFMRAGLAKLGYEQPRRLVLDVRWGQGDDSRFPALAREILARKPAVIFSSCGPAQRAIRDLNRTIPLFATCAQMANFLGEVKSMRRPGGATTGFMMLSSESAGKRLELLKEIRPDLARVAVLHNRVDNWQDYWRETERAASKLGVTLLRLSPIQRAADVEGALAEAVASRAHALVLFPDATTVGAVAQIAAIALRHRLMVADDTGLAAESGGLLSYSPDWQDLYERIVPLYIDKILKGASPSELPIVQPTKFYLSINRKTADTLGLKIPPSMLMRADRVVE